MSKDSSPYVLKQLEEALEERQGTDRRKNNNVIWPKSSERRTKDRRKSNEPDSK